MNIDFLKFGHEAERTVKVKSVGRRAWRKVIFAEFSSGEISVGIREDVRFLDDSRSNWRETNIAVLALNKSFECSQEHMWYDGEHCRYQLGPFVFYNSGFFGNCVKGITK